MCLLGVSRPGQSRTRKCLPVTCPALRLPLGGPDTPFRPGRLARPIDDSLVAHVARINLNVSRKARRVITVTLAYFSNNGAPYAQAVK
jgi:hypothetical protein